MIRSLLSRLRRDTGGVALIEFAWTMPIVLSIGCYGVEVANLALVNMRVSQIALTLADNASRVGATSALSTQQLREIDINDVLEAVRLQGKGLELTTRGRVILSSLENVQQSYDTAPVQRIHWQRCIGLKGSLPAESTYNARWGSTTKDAGSDDTQANAGLVKSDGMGPDGKQVKAPDGSAVMFVEVNYQTKPLFGAMLIAPKQLHYEASFIVRDRREFTRVFNPDPALTATEKSTCDRYTA